MKNTGLLTLIALLSGLTACSTLPKNSSSSTSMPFSYKNYVAQPANFQNHTLTAQQKTELNECQQSADNIKDKNLSSIYGLKSNADMSGSLLVGCLGQYGWQFFEKNNTGIQPISSTTLGRKLMGLE